MSCNDMNKLNVGTLAVSRYHQLSRFFPLDDAPDYPDHDFPYRNAKIIPSGYMLLQQPPVAGRRIRSRSWSPERQEAPK